MAGAVPDLYPEPVVADPDPVVHRRTLQRRDSPEDRREAGVEVGGGDPGSVAEQGEGALPGRIEQRGRAVLGLHRLVAARARRRGTLGRSRRRAGTVRGQSHPRGGRCSRFHHGPHMRTSARDGTSISAQAVGGFGQRVRRSPVQIPSPHRFLDLESTVAAWTCRPRSHWRSAPRAASIRSASRRRFSSKACV